MTSVEYREEAGWPPDGCGSRSAYRLWLPTSPRALLVIVHGFGEHGGRYRVFAEALAHEGLCVAVPDLNGHGRSEGPRGHLGSIAVQVAVLQHMVQDVFLPASGQSRFVVFGHSFGGLVAILWALKDSSGVRRLIVQSPLLEAGFPIPRWKTTLATILAHCWPNLVFSTDLDQSALCRDDAVIRAYAEDPLVHALMSAGTYWSMTRTRNQVLAHAASLKPPTLMLYGSADRIISLEIAQRWFDRLSCVKRRVMFDGCYHELHFEPVRQEVIALVREWTLGHEGAGS